MVMEQIANLSTCKRCQGSNPCLSAKTQSTHCITVSSFFKKKEQEVFSKFCSLQKCFFIGRVAQLDRASAF